MAIVGMATVSVVVSQVSAVPGGIGDTWSKARRFGAAWDLIRRVRPAACLVSATLPLRCRLSLGLSTPLCLLGRHVVAPSKGNCDGQQQLVEIADHWWWWARWLLLELPAARIRT